MGFLLQQGYGMMGINEELASNIQDLGVILSPRALQVNSDIKRLEEHAKSLQKKNVRVLFDPQFYVPRTNMDKITKFPYFEGLEYSTTEFSSQFAKRFSRNVINYQINNLGVDEIIIPNIYTNSITSDWYDISEALIDGALETEDKRVKYLSVPLGPDVVKNRDSFDHLISILTQYDVDGYYFVFKSPKNYLSDDEDYLYSILDAFISLNLANKRVMLGYGNQQDLMFASCGVTDIASGNFRNVRSFDPEIFFDEDVDEGIKRRGIWYYDGNTLSEYKIQQLTLAYRRGLYNHFGPTCMYCENLLQDPNTALWKEGDAFRHYLFEINRQWSNIIQIPASERIDYVIEILEQANNTLNELIDNGVRLGNRAFSEDIMDGTLNALYAIKADRSYDIEQLKDM